MRNFITFVCLAFLLGPLSLALAIVYPFSKKGAKRLSDYCVKKMPVKVFGVLERINGFKFFSYEETKANLPQKFILISNHQSIFDIPAFLRFMPEVDLRFIAKDTLGKGVPLVSPMLKSQGHCLIPRKVRPMESIKLISEFGRRADSEGVVPVIFPEGTRSRDGELGKFLSAGLRTLEDSSHLPIVVCALDGGWKFAGLKGIIQHMHKGCYRVAVLKVYDAPNNKEECQKILDEGKALIQEKLNEWRAKSPMER